MNHAYLDTVEEVLIQVGFISTFLLYIISGPFFILNFFATVAFGLFIRDEILRLDSYKAVCGKVSLKKKTPHTIFISKFAYIYIYKQLHKQLPCQVIQYMSVCGNHLKP